MVTAHEFIESQKVTLEWDFAKSGTEFYSTLPYISGDGQKVFYGVLLWHPYDVSRRVEEVSYEIAERVPSLACRAEDAHVGVVVHKGSEAGDVVLRKLAEAVHKAKNNFRVPRLEYDGWFCNAESVIAAGTGRTAVDDAFVGIVNSMVDGYDGEGVERKRLAQITANRFLAERTQEELKAAGFFEYVGRLPPLGESRPRKLGVIKQTIDRSGSVIEAYEIFKLSA